MKQNELVSQQDCIEEARRDFEKAKQDEEKRLSKLQRMENEIEVPHHIWYCIVCEYCTGIQDRAELTGTS